MDEQELSRRLDAAAASVSARPDLAEIELGAGRVRSRRRIATGVVAAMLVAGAGGAGFGLGRSVSDGDAGLASADRPAAAPTARDAGDDRAPADADESSAGAESPAAPAPPTSAESNTAGDLEGSFATEADGGALGYWAPEPMELLYERTLDSGVRVRAQAGQTWDNTWTEGDWTAADFCNQSRDGRVTFDGPDIVDVGNAGWWTSLFRGIQAQPGVVGWVDDHPIRYLTVQADPGITDIAVTWEDGLSDRTSVVDGFAVLVVEPSETDVDPWSLGYELEVTDASGSRVVTSADLNYYDDPEYRAACNPPPPSLPDPGEQPADPEAAEQALRDRFDLLWDQTVERDDKRAALDDWTGVDEAVEAALTGGYADAAGTASHQIDEISFTSPTEAWFRYTLFTDVTNFYERYGTATLVDGGWQFARAVMCQDLALAGANCEPGFEQIYPPSWYERYGGPYDESCYETDEGMVCAEPAMSEPIIDEPEVGAPVGTSPASEG